MWRLHNIWVLTAVLAASCASAESRVIDFADGENTPDAPAPAQGVSRQQQNDVPCQHVVGGNFDYAGFTKDISTNTISLEFQPDLFRRFKKLERDQDEGASDFKIFDYTLFHGSDENGINVVAFVTKARPCPRSGCEMHFYTYMKDSTVFEPLLFDGKDSISSWDLPYFSTNACAVQRVIFHHNGPPIFFINQDGARDFVEQGLHPHWIRKEQGKENNDG